jgi:hypothetical protein
MEIVGARPVLRRCIANVTLVLQRYEGSTNVAVMAKIPVG